MENIECEHCNDCESCQDCKVCAYCTHCEKCIGCTGCKDCIDCKSCIYCYDMNGKMFYVFNKEVTIERYFELIVMDMDAETLTLQPEFDQEIYDEIVS